MSSWTDLIKSLSIPRDREWEPGDSLVLAYNQRSVTAPQPMYDLKDDLAACKNGSCAICHHGGQIVLRDTMTVRWAEIDAENELARQEVVERDAVGRHRAG